MYAISECLYEIAAPKLLFRSYNLVSLFTEELEAKEVI